MSRIFALVSTLALIAPVVTHARNFADFITVERDRNSQITKVVLNKTSKFSSQMLAEDFISRIEMAGEEVGFLENQLEKTDWPKEHQKKAEEAISYLKQVDLKSILENSEIKKAFGLIFEASESGTHNFRVLAVPNDPKYFDSNETALKVIHQASGIIKLAMGNSYGAALALFVAQSAFDMILERRIFFQNYLLYHLEKYGPQKFGLTEAEADLVKSSIFESRIPWWKFWERTLARQKWERYGHDMHLDTLIAAKRSRKRETGELNQWEKPLGFAFHAGQAGANKLIVNMVTPRSVISKKLSHAFEFSSPTKIASLRMFYFLLQMGVRLAPVPVVSNVFDFFVDSLYIPQRQMEGALLGYFDDENSDSECRAVAIQTINPFIIAEVLF
ncbi:MAG: hypothetical protein A4S09_14240 [Proteobacteria bacterium SG_bin7]|nr:MAG: hypothetical protein A4S09_14240 [Proteobacteria bacterium SG_bin7]